MIQFFVSMDEIIIGDMLRQWMKENPMHVIKSFRYKSSLGCFSIEIDYDIEDRIKIGDSWIDAK